MCNKMIIQMNYPIVFGGLKNWPKKSRSNGICKPFYFYNLIYCQVKQNEKKECDKMRGIGGQTRLQRQTLFPL